LLKTSVYQGVNKWAV